MVWRKVQVNHAKCENCGLVFKDGEKVYMKFRSGSVLRYRHGGDPNRLMNKNGPFRCEECYKKMWH